ncbi:MAG: AMP-binding protein, partial [Planctomycetota bacterium]
MRRSLADAFDATAGRSGSRPAVVESGGSLSFHELRAWSETIGSVLGDVDGHRVGVVLPNSAAFVATFFAIARGGGAAAPLNVGY